MGDINGDGHGDLVGVNGQDGSLYRWYGDGNGGFASGIRLGAGWGSYSMAS